MKGYQEYVVNDIIGKTSFASLKTGQQVMYLPFYKYLLRVSKFRMMLSERNCGGSLFETKFRQHVVRQYGIPHDYVNCAYMSYVEKMLKHFSKDI